MSPDGRFIVSESHRRTPWDKTLKVWDVNRDPEPRTLAGHTGVRAWAVSPDWQFIASGNSNGALEVKDAESGRVMVTLPGHAEIVRVSPDGRFIFSSGHDHTLEVWDIAAEEQVAMIPLPGRVDSVASHPWRPSAAASDATHALYLIDLVGLEFGPIIVTAFQRDGRGTLRCPKCWQIHPLTEMWLGHVIDCPTDACDLMLQVNPFVAGEADAHREGRR